MTNFRLFQTETVYRRQFQIKWKFDENFRKLNKQAENTVGKGEIARYEQFLLFPQSFQKWHALQTGLVWKRVTDSERFWPMSACMDCMGSHQPILVVNALSSYFHMALSIQLWFINPLPNKPRFSHVCSTSLLKTLWEKEKLLIMSNFSFFHVFYPFTELSAIFIESRIFGSILFQYGRIKNLSIGKGLSNSYC